MQIRTDGERSGAIIKKIIGSLKGKNVRVSLVKFHLPFTNFLATGLPFLIAMEQQKILIISYFFTPCNLPGAQRPASWAKYLHEYGYTPIVITRNWEQPVKTSTDLFVPMGESVIHKKMDGYEVYYLPFKGGLRDFIITRFGEHKLVAFRKVLSYLELFAQNFTSRFIPYRNFFSFAHQLIKKDPAIRIIISSAGPFGLFRLCSRLSRKTGIPWIADYRDDWNTTAWTSNYSVQSQISGKNSFQESVLTFFEAKSEKRWVSSATLFTTVSKYYVSKISNYVLRPGKVIYNGYEVENKTGKEGTNPVFTISYLGTLYWKQSIEIFLNGFVLARRELNTREMIINFIGTGFDSGQRERLEKYARTMDIEIVITDWMHEREVNKIIAASHLMLSVAYNGVKGVIPTKVFNYLAWGKPVLLCPSDHDELEETAQQSGLGLIANDQFECAKKIVEAYHCFHSGKPLVTPNESFISNFSRKHQTEKLAQIIGHIIH